MQWDGASQPNSSAEDSVVVDRENKGVPRKMKGNPVGSKNLGNRIFEWQLTGRAPCKLHMLPPGFQGRLDEAYEGIPQLVQNLRNAVQRGNPTALAAAMSATFSKLVDHPGAGEPPVTAHSSHGAPGSAQAALLAQARRHREAFVLFGGPQQVVAAFRPPFAAKDAREMDPGLVGTRRAEMWNEALVLLRELCFAHPGLAESPCGAPDLVVFWFTLMAHTSTFDNAVGLIEEVLAVNPTTFALSQINNLYGLVHGFSCRQLAHFCRVVALLVFEPEDRQLVESSKVLRSLELLQLRRDRVARAHTTIDCNQALILSMPDLLSRLVKLLRFMNYSPPLSRLSTHHMMAHFPSTLDVLLMLRGHNEHDDWDHLDSLDQIVRRSQPKDAFGHCPSSSDPFTSSTAQQDGRNAPAAPPPTARGVMEAFLDLLNPFVDGSAADQHMGFGDISRLMQAINNFQASRTIPQTTLNPPVSTHNTGGVVNTPPQQAGGQGFPSWRPHDHDEAPPATATHSNAPPRRPFRSTAAHLRTPQEASSELQFNAVLLSPHQVEVLFVLCTLLGGRRKVDVQDKLAKLGLIPALEEMFPRLSWGAPPQTGPNPLERIHGPGCECNPESALRVQYLRLIHNFCDRDCDNNPHKNLMLSSDEQQALVTGKRFPGMTKGLLSKIITELMREPADSLYKFWLASCAEAYLRGSSVKDQLFVAESGLLNHLLQEVFSDGLRCTGSLQTAFDLLGELTKGNRMILELLESMLSDNEVEKLMTVVTDNLVDSNVFVRSLVLTIDHASQCFEKNRGFEQWRGHKDPSYLMHSWCEVPAVQRHVPTSSSSVIPLQSPHNESTENTLKDPTQYPQSSSPSRLIFNMHIDENMCSSTELATGHQEANSIWQRWPVPPSIRRIERSLCLKLPALLRDLMSVVDLEGINHENICCLNTVIVILIFANRRNQLATVLDLVRRTEAQPKKLAEFSFVKKPPTPDGGEENSHSHGHGGGSHYHHSRLKSHLDDEAGPRRDLNGRQVLQNFRRLLWFWKEYYTHRGRDRLSLEFSSHVRFTEWQRVVTLLCADDGSPTALTNCPLPTPRSPYSRLPRPAQITTVKFIHSHE